MKRLLQLLDDKISYRLETLMEKIIIKYRLEEKDKPSCLKDEIRFKSTYPKDQPSLEEWCKEYRVSILHNRHAVYFG